LCERRRGDTPKGTFGKGRQMRRLIVVGVLALCLSFTASAVAAEENYSGGVKYWQAGWGAGSSFNSGWKRTTFGKFGNGWDTAVTFIDNASYSWHMTVRNREQLTQTWWFTSQTKKGHCRAYMSNFYGECKVYS
jgi:hypothetical protein